ncbi:MAG: GreA/GreB family elongation factor [Patescibacteria group bacterium]|nr:GreA/GreB family elongation factor [Patescibacteria group bacterium]
MRLPIRKPGKYTHLKPDQNLTEAKYNELKNKLDRLLLNRPRLAEEVKQLAELGDFSENAAYQIAKGRLRGVNQRILEIEDQLRRAVIIRPNRHSNIVQLGSSVTIATANRTKTFLILGSAETNPGRGIISSRSPLGAGLMGKMAGDKIKIKLAGQEEVEYKIIKIT